MKPRLTTRTRAALLLGAAIVLAAPRLALAQATEPEALIDAGVAARRAGDDAGALALFTQAWGRGHAPRARAQMGLAEQALGRFVDAEAHLSEALAATQDEWIAGRRATLEEALGLVRARLAQLEVRVDQPGARLFVDGREVGTLPLARPLWLVPGTVVIELRAPRFASSTRRITVTAAELSRESFMLVPATSHDDPGAERPSDSTEPVDGSGSALPTLGWITGGVGVVGLGLGVVFYVRRENAVGEYNSDACVPPTGASRDETCGAFARDARSAELLETISFVAGGALVAGGLALVLLSGGSGSRTPRRRPRAYDARRCSAPSSAPAARGGSSRCPC